MTHHNKQAKPEGTSDADWDLYNRRRQADLLRADPNASAGEIAALFKRTEETEGEKIRRKMFNL
jgi:hypothetical protein